MATDSLYSTIVTKVRDLIAGLSLSGVSASNIIVTKLPWSRDYAPPASGPFIIVCREQDRIRPSTNEAYDVEYGVWVIYAAAGNQNLTGSLTTLDGWRQSITRLFQGRSIIASMAIQEVYNCRVEAGTPEWLKGFQAQYDVGALRVIATTREPR